jgi:hypothetical protein
MPRPRDSVRAKLYRAEWTIRNDSPRLPTSEDVERFIEKVLTSAYVQTRWGRVAVQYRQTRGGGGNYNSWAKLIQTGKDTTEYVILHEIAHALTPNRYAAHGPEFAAVLLTLVDRFGRPGDGRTLRAAFAAGHVKYRNGFADAVPKPGTHLVTTKTERAAAVTARRKAQVARPVSQSERVEAAAILRRLVAQGEFGPAGRKPRAHALEVARKLETRG